jgi:MFS family permease
MSLGNPRELFAVANPREVGLVTVAHGVNEFYSVALPPIIPLLVTDFDVTYGEAGALLTVFFTMYSVFQLPAGVVADRVGQRRLLAAGMVVLSAGILVSSVAPNYETLVAGQVLAGVGGSTYHPAGMSLISDIETGETEGKAMGIHGLGGVTGTALAPALIGGLAALYDWRVALTVAAGVGIVYAVVFYLLFPDVADAGAETATDGAGAEATDASVDAADAGGAEPAPDDGERAPGLAAAARRGAEKVVNVPLAGWVLVLFVTNFFISLELGAVRTFATSYLFERTGGSTTEANAIFFVMLVGAGIASVGAGHLADRSDRTLIGFGAMAAAALLLAVTAFVPASVPVLVAWFFLLGVLSYAVYPAMNAITSAYSERDFSGSLFAVMLTAGSLGGAVGPVAFGVVAERVGMTVAFPGIAVVAAVAAAMFLVVRRL